MLRRICGLMLGIVVVSGGMVPGDAGAPRRHASEVIRVGIFPFEPLCVVRASGEVEGVFPELLLEAVADTFFKIEFVPVTWAQGFDGLQTGFVDLMPCVAYSPERAVAVDFCYESVVEVWGQVFVRPNRKIETIADLDGQRVAVLAKDINGENFLKMAESMGVRCEVITFGTHREVMQAVQAGAAVGGVVSQHYGYRHAGDFGLVPSSIQFAPVSLYFAAAKGKHQDLLSLIDWHLIHWKDDRTSPYYRILRRWLGVGNGSGIRMVYGLVAGLVLAGVGAVVGVTMNRMLKRQVRLKTRELLVRERQYRGLIESANSIVIRMDAHARILFMNSYGLAFFGYEERELIGRELIGTIIPEKVEEGIEISTLIYTIFADPETYSLLEHENMRKDGSRVFVQWSHRAVLNEDGTIQEMVSVGIDRTEQRKAAQALRESERHYRHLFENMTTAFVLHEMVYDDGVAVDYRFLEVNPAYERITGQVASDLVGKTCREVMSVLDVAQFCRFAEVAEHGHPIAFEQYSADLDRYFDTWVFSPAKGQFAVVFSDVTDRRKAVGELKLLSTAINQAAEGVLITSASGEIQYVNPAFEQMSGYPAAEVLGQNPRMLSSGRQSSRFYEQMWGALRSGTMWSGRLENRRKDGSIYYEEDSIAPVKDAEGRISSYVAVKRDITREVNLEAQYRQSQKMEAVGQLAGGVAHDFNNILQSILGFSELLLAALEDERAKEDVREIMKAARHGGELTRQLLTFSRKHHVEFSVQDLNQIILDEEKMLNRLLGTNVRVETLLEPNLTPVHADRVQITQVLMNLCVNGRDAMPDGGVLSIRTKNCRMGAEEAKAIPGARAGRFVCLQVEDTGRGMSHEVKEHLFEPFFTTKGLGEGSGLGLAVVYGIVQQYDGWIEVESRPGQGSVFTIYFAVDESPSRSAVDAREKDEIKGAKGAGETILLVEDEPVVQELAARMLEGSNYRVVRAASAAQARQQLASGAAIDLVLCDVGLPDERGTRLVRSLIGQYPGIEVLFSSGYGDTGDDVEFFLEQGFGFIQKPYSVELLLKKVRAQLDRISTRSSSSAC